MVSYNKQQAKSGLEPSGFMQRLICGLLLHDKLMVSRDTQNILKTNGFGMAKRTLVR